MDAEIEDIKRRAGLLTEQGETVADAATAEKLNEFLLDEVDFLGKLGQVLARAMAPDRARQVLGVIGQRRDALQQSSRQVQAAFRSQKDPRRQAQADQYADTEQPQSNTSGFSARA